MCPNEKLSGRQLLEQQLVVLQIVVSATVIMEHSADWGCMTERAVRAFGRGQRRFENGSR